MAPGSGAWGQLSLFSATKGARSQGCGYIWLVCQLFRPSEQLYLPFQLWAFSLHLTPPLALFRSLGFVSCLSSLE